MHVRTRLIEKHKEVEKWICKRLMISMCQGRVETIAAWLPDHQGSFVSYYTRPGYTAYTCTAINTQNTNIISTLLNCDGHHIGLDHTLIPRLPRSGTRIYIC